MFLGNDKNGNLYVAHHRNSRIQKFGLGPVQLEPTKWGPIKTERRWKDAIPLQQEISRSASFFLLHGSTGSLDTPFARSAREPKNTCGEEPEDPEALRSHRRVTMHHPQCEQEHDT